MRLSRAFLVGSAVLLSGATYASPPRLVESRPADDGIASRPASIALTFDQQVTSAEAGYDILMVTMPGMTMEKPMRMDVASSAVEGDRKTITAALKAPLPPGTYEVTWRIKSATGEPGTGILRFGVR